LSALAAEGYRVGVHSERLALLLGASMRPAMACHAEKDKVVDIFIGITIQADRLLMMDMTRCPDD
jgi:hypothetical protein